MASILRLVKILWQFQPKLANRRTATAKFTAAFLHGLGHNRPDAHSPEPTLKGRLYSGTCRMAYGSNSVGTVESKDS